MMTKQTLIQNALLALAGLAGITFLFSLTPSRRGEKFDSVAETDNNAPQIDQLEIRWGEPVHGLRLGIVNPLLRNFGPSGPLPGQQFGVGLCVENVGKDPIKVEKSCSTGIRAQIGQRDMFEDMPSTAVKDDPLYNFALLFKDEIEPGETVQIWCGFSYEVRKGFLRVGNRSFGPFLAGHFTFTGNASLGVRGEPGAEKETITLTSGPTSFAIRDDDWGAAHDGMQIALAEYRFPSTERDSPVFGFLCRNCSEKHILFAGGVDPVANVRVCGPNGKTELYGPECEGSLVFDLQPGEIELLPHGFRWNELKETMRGEYAFSVETSRCCSGTVWRVFKTNTLKLKRPE
jgi:hypothetical protein